MPDLTPLSRFLTLTLSTGIIALGVYILHDTTAGFHPDYYSMKMEGVFGGLVLAIGAILLAVVWQDGRRGRAG